MATFRVNISRLHSLLEAHPTFLTKCTFSTQMLHTRETTGSYLHGERFVELAVDGLCPLTEQRNTAKFPRDLQADPGKCPVASRRGQEVVDQETRNNDD